MAARATTRRTSSPRSLTPAPPKPSTPAPRATIAPRFGSPSAGSSSCRGRTDLRGTTSDFPVRVVRFAILIAASCSCRASAASHAGRIDLRDGLTLAERFGAPSTAARGQPRRQRAASAAAARQRDDASFVERLEDGSWVRHDLLDALRVAYPDFAGTVHAGGYGTDRVDWMSTAAPTLCSPSAWTMTAASATCCWRRSTAARPGSASSSPSATPRRRPTPTTGGT